MVNFSSEIMIQDYLDRDDSLGLAVCLSDPGKSCLTIFPFEVLSRNVYISLVVTSEIPFSLIALIKRS